MSRFAKPLSLRPDPHGAQALPETAMLLAAGLGKRMRPLTATRPKPLVEVAGRALLDHALDRVRAAGVTRAVVNVHYLADALEAHVRRHAHGLDIVDLGRARRTARDRRRRRPRRCRCSATGRSTSSTPTISGSTARSTRCGCSPTAGTTRAMDALLLVVPLARATAHGGQGDFHMDAEGRLTRRQPRRVAPFVYTGVQLVSPRLLADAPGGAFSMNLLWDRAIAAEPRLRRRPSGAVVRRRHAGAIAVAEEMLKGG